MNARRWQILARCLWAAAALGILCWGTAHRFALPPEPLLDDDGFGYLGPGLSKLTGGVFGHFIGREFLYPVFVFLNLCVFGDFRAITVGQHLLGVATAGLLLAAWQPLLAVCRAPGNPTVRDARSFLVAAAWQLPALVMANVYLAYNPTLLIEHTIRPESVFAFAAALSLWVNLRFVRAVWLDGCPAVAWKLGAAHLFLTGVLLLLRPSCAFAAVFINLPLAVALGTRKEVSWMVKGRPVALALGAMALFLYLPESLLRRQDGLATTLNPSIRLLSHADLVLAQMDADLASPGPPRYDRAMLQPLRDRLAAALAESRLPANDPWPRLGFNPDHMYTRCAVFAPFFAPGPEGDHALARLCDDYCVRAVLHHPLAMTGKVFSQFGFFYSLVPTRRFINSHFRGIHRFLRSLTKVRLNDADLYPLTIRITDTLPLKPMIDRSLAGQAYARGCEHLSHFGKAVPQPPAVKWIDDLFQAAYMPLLLLTLAACAVIPWVRRLRASLGLAAWTTLLLYSYNFGVCLTIATVFYLGEFRYIAMQKAFMLFSDAAGLVFLARCAGEIRRSRTTPSPAGRSASESPS